MTERILTPHGRLDALYESLAKRVDASQFAITEAYNQGLWDMKNAVKALNRPTLAELEAILDPVRRGENADRELCQHELSAPSETAPTGWIAAKERQPEGDGDVLVAHPVYAKTATEWCGVTVRSASTVRSWVKYPEDTSMADGFWMYLPKGPL